MKFQFFLLFLLYLRFCCFCSLCYFCSLQLLLLTLSVAAAAVSRSFRLLELYWQNAAGCIQACGIPTHFICCFVMFLKFFYAINTCFMACFQTNTCIFILLLFLKKTLLYMICPLSDCSFRPFWALPGFYLLPDKAAVMGREACFIGNISLCCHM